MTRRNRQIGRRATTFEGLAALAVIAGIILGTLFFRRIPIIFWPLTVPLLAVVAYSTWMTRNQQGD